MLRRVREQKQGGQGEGIVSWAQSSWGAASQSRAEGSEEEGEAPGEAWKVQHSVRVVERRELQGRFVYTQQQPPVL